MTVHDTAMTVECRTCPVRELHCGDCMVPVLLDLTAPALRPDSALDQQERAAVTRLVEAGLVSPEAAALARAAVATAGSHAPVTGQGGRAVG
jgi:hypothetical protein